MAKPKVSTIIWIIVTVILVASVGLLANMLNQTKATLQQRENELAALQDERDSLQQEVDRVKTENTELQNNVKAMDEEVARLKEELDTTQTANTSLSRDLDARKKEITTLRSDIDKVGREKNALAGELVKAKDEISSSKELLDQVRSAKEALENKIKELMAQKEVELGKVVVQPGETTSTGMQLQGQVLSINKRYNFAVINLGKNDGVTQGMKFEVKLNDETVAQLEVEKVYDTMSAANISAQKKEVQKGYIVNSI